MNTSVTQATPRQPARFRVWHAVAIFGVANAVSILPAGFNGDEAFYNAFTRPAAAPPDWLFAPMWLFLNVTSLIALGRVANAERLTGAHRAFFVLEGVNWVLFAAFNTLYFGLKSPVLGAVDTAAGLLLGLASLGLAARLDRRAAWLILPRIVWLLLATYVSGWVALNNADPFFGGQ
ncbi:tryptophan-rich sensory protein [Deinococcus sp. Arct2-2]|uniref:TspO/MBR family protein n=1 Tax=Deinococcus sp. Arct2-2 TaxID=2568653 RepID=UPI0010A453FA|nr:TspO/MBR family protein [Deinococcus sp. Arct2-2]THF67708.1 tryptophan-rich sensory protein [Deinococcus sp. Arct2-2]